MAAGVGAALILLGVLSLLTVTYYFLLILGGAGLISLGLAGVARLRSRMDRIGAFERNVGLFAFATPVLTGIVVASLTGVTREVEHVMSWEYGKPRLERPDLPHVILRFVRFPCYRIGIYSKDVGAYLESRGAREVPVRFVVTTDFGKVRGFREKQIGDLRQWHAESSYYGQEWQPGQPACGLDPWSRLE